MLKLESCSYTPLGAEKPTLEVDALTVHSGEQFVIVGPSGSGKTTLLQALSGLLFYKETEGKCLGHLRINGELVSSDEAAIRNKGIAYLSQELGLWPHLTCLEQLSFILTGGRSLKDKKGKFWLEQVKLDHRSGSRPRQLSGGEQKRLALARVLASRPKYLFLDEPFANIDLVLAEELFEIIIAQHKAEAFSLITVSHHRLATKKENSRIIMMDQGRIAKDGSFEEIINRPVNNWSENWTRLVV